MRFRFARCGKVEEINGGPVEFYFILKLDIKVENFFLSGCDLDRQGTFPSNVIQSSSKGRTIPRNGTKRFLLFRSRTVAVKDVTTMHEREKTMLCFILGQWTKKRVYPTSIWSKACIFTNQVV